MAQGLGQALLEHPNYAEHGTLLTTSLSDYALPRSTSLPEFAFGETVTPTPRKTARGQRCGRGRRRPW